MLQTSSWYVITNTYVVSKNVPFSAKNTLILLMAPYFFAKIIALIKATI